MLIDGVTLSDVSTHVGQEILLSSHSCIDTFTVLFGVRGHEVLETLLVKLLGNEIEALL